MYVPFNELPPDSRIWIYQASLEFTAPEAEKIEAEIRQFVTQWSAHGKQLLASGTLLHNRFVVLGTDEKSEMPSGCSIDSSVQFIRSLEAAFNASFFDRTQLAFKQQDKIITMPLNRLKEGISAGQVNPETLYFDNLVNRAANLSGQWIKPAKESWLGKYFSHNTSQRLIIRPFSRELMAENPKAK